METANEPAAGAGRMRIVGGNLALDFVNTRTGPPSGPPDDDLFAGYDDVVAWGRHVGSLTDPEARRLRRAAQEDRAGSRKVFGRAIRLRDDLDAVFRAVAVDRRPPAQAVGALRTAEAKALVRAELVADDGAFAWSWASDRSLERPLGPVIHAAIELLTGGPLDRVKACGGCSFLFLDESKNRSRRWCSMEDCGTSEKIRRILERRAGRRLA
ncbi:MAG TPA: ABATE domain-containing protein [Candidatus Limnocylindrales bacterium]|nr:ABATE domain-containing protein [Candidatus Limnocylindrales bacterium]